MSTVSCLLCLVFVARRVRLTFSISCGGQEIPQRKSQGNRARRFGKSLAPRRCRRTRHADAGPNGCRLESHPHRDEHQTHRGCACIGVRTMQPNWRTACRPTNAQAGHASTGGTLRAGRITQEPCAPVDEGVELVHAGEGTNTGGAETTDITELGEVHVALTATDDMASLDKVRKNGGIWRSQKPIGVTPLTVEDVRVPARIRGIQLSA